MRILIITYKYIPLIAPRVFRWSSVIREWIKDGIDVDVICAVEPGCPDFEVIDGANVHRIRPWFKKEIKPDRQENDSAERIRNFLNQVDITQNPVVAQTSQDTDESQIQQKKSLVEKGLIFAYYFLRRIKNKAVQLVKRGVFRTKNNIKKILRNNLWPDYGMPWIPPAVLRAKKLITENSYDAIISVSWPVSPHVVGWIINQWFAKKLPWIVDIGDPFSFNLLTPINDFKRFSKLNHRFESNMLHRASYVTVTTEKTKIEYERQFSINQQKIRVIPPLISIDAVDNESIRPIFAERDYVKRLVFTGSLRKNNRRPDLLLELFVELLERYPRGALELHFFGDVKQCMSSFLPYRQMLDDQLFLHGIVAKDVVDQALLEADVLINVGNVSENQLPSKIVEYLASNKPIINIASSPNDSSWEVLSLSPLAINVCGPVLTPIMIDRIAQFIKTPPPSLDDSSLEKLVDPYRISSINRQYLELIQTGSNLV